MARETLKELKYNGQKVIAEVARRDAAGRTISTTYALRSEIISERIAINLADIEETNLDITDYSQLWLEIFCAFTSSPITIYIGVMSGSSKTRVLTIPVADVSGGFHAMVCITKADRTSFAAYYNSSTTALQFDGGYASSTAGTIYIEAPGITSSSTLIINGFAILE